MTLSGYFYRHKAQLNHALARLDGLESVKQAAPLKRVIAPAMAATLGGAILVDHARHAPTPEVRKKVLLRDGLVMGGTLLGLMGSAVVMQRLGGGGHAHEHAEHAVKKVGEEVQALFRSQLHDHGATGFLKLLVLALGGVLGGGAAGTLADRLNGEDLRQTVPMKVKEGVFQFFGNVAVCTGALWVFSTGGKHLGRWLAQFKPLAQRAEKAVLKQIEMRTALPDGHSGLLPSELTQELTAVTKQAQLELKNAPTISHDLQHKYEDILKAWLPKDQVGAFLPRLGGAGLQKEISQKASQNFRNSLEALRQESASGQPLSKELQATVQTLGQARTESQVQLAGVLSGLVVGVVGGAWASNRLNEGLTKAFSWPEGHGETRLFSGKSEGWLSDQVGDRGIHWWDALLHVDDWPSVLYMAGVQALESMIAILYGISGFLTGVAGTDYTQAPSLPTPPASAPITPLQRSHAGFRAFQGGHAE